MAQPIDQDIFVESDETEEEGQIWGGEIPPLYQPSSPVYNENEVIEPSQEQQEQQLSGRTRRREESPEGPLRIKIYRDQSGNKVKKQSPIDFNQLKLTSGETYYFRHGDHTLILQNDSIEPNIFIRKLLSRMPVKGLKNRMDFLSHFLDAEVDYDEDSIEATFYFENFKENFFTAVLRELRLRYIFRKLFVLWRIKKMEKACDKEMDPITLGPPEKEVAVYDWQVKKKFILDARSLANLIESKLLYQEYGFPVPLIAKNPRTNTEFKYSQLVSIYFQLKEHGEQLWGLTTLRQYNFNKHRWFQYHKSALTMSAIKNSILLLDTREGRDLLEDFITAKMEELEIPVNNMVTDVLRKAMIRAPKHWYLEQCKALAVTHYEAEHFNLNKKQLINACCLRLFKKQRKFFRELSVNKII